jgi:hypothetical protein
MTAIAIAQLSNGFVIAADGRMRLDVNARVKATAPELARETEYAQKIFEITGRDKKLAWTITGNIANDDFSFDLVETINQQARLLAGQKFGAFESYANRLSFNVSRRIRTAKQWREFYATMSLLGYFNGSRVFILISFHPGRSDSPFTLTDYSGYRTLLAGADSVRRAMYHSDGTPQNSSPLSQYAINISNDSNLDDGARFAKGFVEACCSEWARTTVPQECDTIGGWVHVAEITPLHFLWRRAPKESAISERQ